ncbi:hypothetical protein PPL_12642 [Heterostelium album PN500]|uniref:DNA-directed DNA polymerase n=1 Tax=Heterostelium pallidum (strain ATCC 26659 / Pp 5 / PN500) TaxID=670386 RepID=D3BN64_HETP5|nr:hypothetical protein PPL_12642 [Heterostelium album PN500]EFA77426.1 hypothetical protein PPL_12642 [Heterostelium album PN500]|eukprot:XP_020429555.1 hypothetical protein PPL_12642 [Heterostelium album PN500]
MNRRIRGVEQPTNLVRFGMQMRQYRYVSRGGPVTRQQIEQKAQELSNRLHARGERGEIQLALRFDDNWRNSKFTKLGNRVSLYVLNDEKGSDRMLDEPDDGFQEFTFYVIPDRTRAGGAKSGRTTLNDCLYDCLKEVYADDLKLTPEQFKAELGLQRNDPVPIDLLHKVEELLPKKPSIIVSGDHTYVGESKKSRTIRLSLRNGHYTLDKSNRLSAKGISFKERKPVAYFRHHGRDDVTVSFYDGKLYQINCFEDINQNDIKFDFDFHLSETCKTMSSPYLFIKCKSLDEMEEKYNSFIRVADIIKKETKDLVNYYKYGNVRQSATHLLLKTLPKDIEIEDVSAEESYWIEQATMSAMIYSVDHYEGPLYKYDYKAMYACIMKDYRFHIPIKRGTFKKLSQDEFNNLKFYQYGIYHASINQEVGQERLFKFNQNDYYTHIDLTRAKELGLQINIINDNNANVLEWDPQSKISCDIIFGNLIEKILNWIKNATDDDVKLEYKMMYAQLWGYLVRKRKQTIYDPGMDSMFKKEDSINRSSNKSRSFVGVDNYEEGDDYHMIESTVYIYNNQKIESIVPHERSNKIILSYTDNVYETPFARLKPFIIAKGRSMISKIMINGLQCEPNDVNNYIKRVHTDGFYSTKKLNFNTHSKGKSHAIDDVQIGVAPGDLKYEGYTEKVIIEKFKKVLGEFK